MNTALITVTLRDEHDVVAARNRTRQIAALLGFDAQEQTRLATAISELARNAVQYARDGRVGFEVEGTPPAPQFLVARVSDAGPGIADVASVLDGREGMAAGAGLGILGARRLAERFRIESAPGRGTVVEVARSLPRDAPFDPHDAPRIIDRLRQITDVSPLAEMRQQNHELLRTLNALRERQVEVERLNRELEDTNRGVVALYAELDDRAEDLRRASQAKSRFLSDVSHELRTPLASVLNLTRILLDRTDGDLASEQMHQITLIRRSITTLAELVNDLLDLAKIEAGKVELRPSDFTVADLFATLRGMCRPLLSGDAVALIFEEAPDIPPLRTDEPRLSQILRNFIANAIKFTESGEIRVRASLTGTGLVRFAVSDTGIGIAPADQARIFEAYTQVDGPVQRRVPGTGLGLPLTRRLAGLLDGRVELVSALGEGSTFSVIIPVRAPDAAAFSSSVADLMGV
jgi:signal transduction histidine kinase